MEDQRLLSIGQVLDRGFTLYRRSLGKVLPFCLGMALMAMVPRLVFHPEAMVKNGHFSGPMGGYVALIFLISIVNLVLTIALIRKLDDVDSGRNQLGATAAFTGGLRYFLPVLGASFLYGVIVMVGFVLLVVPGIILSVSLMLGFYALVLDGAGIVDSLKRSRGLVRGHWWRTWTIITVTMLIYLAVYIGVTALATLILPFGNVMATAAGQAAPNTIGLLLMTLVLALVNSLLLPIFYAITLVAYRDLQLRKGGEDLAARIAAAV